MFTFFYTLSIASKISVGISSDDSVELSAVSSSREINGLTTTTMCPELNRSASKAVGNAWYISDFPYPVGKFTKTSFPLFATLLIAFFWCVFKEDILNLEATREKTPSSSREAILMAHIRPALWLAVSQYREQIFDMWTKFWLVTYGKGMWFKTKQPFVGRSVAWRA